MSVWTHSYALIMLRILVTVQTELSFLKTYWSSVWLCKHRCGFFLNRTLSVFQWLNSFCTLSLKICLAMSSSWFRKNSVIAERLVTWESCERRWQIINKYNTITLRASSHNDACFQIIMLLFHLDITTTFHTTAITVKRSDLSHVNLLTWMFSTGSMTYKYFQLSFFFLLCQKKKTAENTVFVRL